MSAETIKNVCAECGNNIEAEQPLDKDEDADEGDIDWMLVRLLKTSTVSVCHTCDPRSQWKRVDTV